MTETALSQLTLESFFIELNGKPDDCRETIIDALLKLGFNASAADGESETQWHVASPLADPSIEGRCGVEVFPPGNERARPREAWLWAHAIAGNLPEHSHVEPTFAGDIELPPPAAAAEESSAGGSDAAPPQDERWHLARIRVPETHAHMSASDVAPGQGIWIGHPDTGYTKHKEIFKASPKPIDVNRGLNLLEEGTPPLDPQEGGIAEQPGHGTATASVAVAQDGVSVKRQGGGRADLLGIAPAARIAPIRVTESVIITWWQRRLALAIEHAVDSGCQVISISLGGLGGSRLNRAIAYAESKGVIVVAAAGNNVGFVVAPATHPYTVACAASDFEDRPWDGTSAGKAVNITAPGHNVWVAGWDDDTPVARPGSGTSYATAAVAGAAALWLSAHADRLAGHQTRIPRLFRSALRASAKAVSALPPHRYGAGLLDCLRLIETDPLATADAEESLTAPASPDRLALQALLQIDVDTESPGAQDRNRAATISRDLDHGALAEFVFHLSLDPQMRRLWTLSDDVTAQESGPQRISEKFSPRLRSQLRRPERAAAEAPAAPSVPADPGVPDDRADFEDPARSEDDHLPIDSAPTPTAHDGAAGTPQEIVIQLNVTVRIETSE